MNKVTHDLGPCALLQAPCNLESGFVVREEDFCTVVYQARCPCYWVWNHVRGEAYLTGRFCTLKESSGGLSGDHCPATYRYARLQSIVGLLRFASTSCLRQRRQALCTTHSKPQRPRSARRRQSWGRVGVLAVHAGSRRAMLVSSVDDGRLDVMASNPADSANGTSTLRPAHTASQPSEWCLHESTSNLSSLGLNFLRADLQVQTRRQAAVASRPVSCHLLTTLPRQGPGESCPTPARRADQPCPHTARASELTIQPWQHE